MSKTALKLALEALEVATTPLARDRQEVLRAQAALREALAEQPAQQVVDSDEKAGAYMEARLWEFIDMAAAWPKASPDPRTWNHVVVYAPKPAQQEPVAWVRWDEEGYWDVRRGPPSDEAVHYLQHINRPPWVPAYPHPPQREWQGLTDEEIDVLVMDSDGLPKSHLEFARAIEAKLKEKNT